MRYLFAMFSALAFCVFASAYPPQAPVPPQAPPARADLCDCTSAVNCTCPPGTCRCPACVVAHQPQQTQEQRWRAEGWQQYQNGEWFRVLRGTALSYEYVPPVQQFSRPQSFPVSGAACVGGR